MLNNYEILDYLEKKKLYKGYGIAQTDCKKEPSANYLLYKQGVDKFFFVNIIEQKTQVKQADGKTKKQEPIAEIIELGSYRFSDFKAVQYDKYALAKRYIFTPKQDGEPLTIKTWLSTIDMIAVVPKQIEITRVDRKWYNNLVGFRSNNPKNMIIGGIVYLAIIAGIVKFAFFN
ncbi:MAG: hypothetical protein KBT36_12735 [Kurthia sp.]|nr:hypothetical protein [Candidatus Kurthia equi]